MSADATTNLPHRNFRFIGVILAIVALILAIVGISIRFSANQKLREWTDAHAIPTIAISSPVQNQSATVLSLPGQMEAYTQAPIYARVSGYLKSWHVDIGTSVKKGQLLAEIETPELDQQLLQAKADLVSAETNANLAGITAKRWENMLKLNAVSRQAVDEKVGDLEKGKALVSAAQASVSRYQAMKAFSKIVAPFSGVITKRSTDVGTLISVGNTAGSELFVISDTSKLRIYVNVPQNYASSIKSGIKAKIRVPNHPEKFYLANYESSAKSINAVSGSMLVQLLIDNVENELLSGGYAEVIFEIPNISPIVTIPGSALIFDKTGLHVAIVNQANKIIMKSVTILRDTGKNVEVSGLSVEDRIVETPPDGIMEGDFVHIATSK